MVGCVIGVAFESVASSVKTYKRETTTLQTLQYITHNADYTCIVVITNINYECRI